MRAIELDPNDAKVYYNRGITYGKKGEFDRAIEDFTKAIDLNPNYADAYYNRGVAYSNKGLVDYTIEDYTKVIALNPNYANAYYNRGKSMVAPERVGKSQIRPDECQGKGQGYYYYVS